MLRHVLTRRDPTVAVAVARGGSEKVLDEVLQIHTIFTNVSKGTVAKKTELAEAFGTADEPEILLEILAKGELQVGKQEREQAQESTLREIARCRPPLRAPYAKPSSHPARQHRGGQVHQPRNEAAIHRRANRARHEGHPLLRQALAQPQGTAPGPPPPPPRESSFAARGQVQALDVIKQLKETIPIERAKMRLRLQLPQKDAKRIKDLVVGKLQVWAARRRGRPRAPPFPVTTMAVVAAAGRDGGLGRRRHGACRHGRPGRLPRRGGACARRVQGQGAARNPHRPGLRRRHVTY